MTLIMMVGLPRSGKTTYVNQYKASVPIVSADQMRLLVYGQKFWGPGEPMMWATRDIMFKALLEQGCDIVIDECNTTIARREPMIKLAKKYGYKIIAEVTKTDAETCLLRAKQEGNEELIAPIQRMASAYEAPTMEEGFDLIEII